MADYPDNETGEEPDGGGAEALASPIAPSCDRVDIALDAPFAPDPALAADDWADTLCRHTVIPCDERDGRLDLAAGTYSDALNAARALGIDGGRIRLVPRAQVVAALTARYGEALARRATDGLRHASPEFSVATGFPLWARASLLGAAALLLAGMIVAPAETAMALWLLLAPYFLATMLLRTFLLWSATRDAPLPTPARRNTPVVSILVPVYHEADSLPALIEALGALDYPVRALDIKILLEEDDIETIAEARRLTADLPFDCLVVPPGGPRTKPKAMNFALPFVRGEIVGIFDAEDAPEPAQIAKAVAKLEHAGEDVVCAQARLSHYNATDNLLTRCVAMEYALWFDMLMNGLARARLPLPLGGTSLYFRTDTLREIGGWDPHNVTEDADLGLRLARAGKRAVIFDSVTREEANGCAISWIKQRSRWIKGYMLTWAVHMRDPARLVRELGLRQAVAISILLLDGFLSFLVQPIMILVAGVAALSAVPAHIDPFVANASVSVAGVLLAGQGLLIVGAFVAARRRFGWRLAIGVPLLWPYWMMGGIAAIKAVWQAATRPQFWEKTAHCTSPVARMRRAAVLDGAD